MLKIEFQKCYPYYALLQMLLTFENFWVYIVMKVIIPILETHIIVFPYKMTKWPGPCSFS